MSKKPTAEQTSSSAVERVGNKERRDFLRASGAAALDAVIPTSVVLVAAVPSTANAQPRMPTAREAFDAIRRQAEKNPPAQQPPVAAPAPNQGNPVPIENNIAAPTARGEGTLLGFSGRAVNLNDNEIPFEDAYKAYNQMKELLKPQEGRNAYGMIYSRNTTNARFTAKKPEFDKANAAINALSAQGQAEVLARIIRDIKEFDDGGQGKSPLEPIRGVFNVFPQAKNIVVAFTKRPYNTGYESFNLDEPARNIRPVQGTVRQYLKENTVNHTDISGGEPNDNRFRTGKKSDPIEVDNMFARDSNVQPTSSSLVR